MSKIGIPLRNGVSVGITAGVGTNSLNALAQAILRSFGANASEYPFATRQGTYQDTGATVPAVAINDPIGLQQDTVGTNNATQTTAINRPTVQRGLWNLLTYSQDFSNAAWAKTAITVSGSSVTRASSATAFLQSAAINIPVGTAFTSAVLARPKSVGGAIGVRTTGIYPDRVDAVFNLMTGAVIGTSNSSFTAPVASIAGPDSFGNYLCVVSGVVASTSAVATLSGPCETSVIVAGWEAGSAVLSDCYIEASATFQGTLTAAQILQQGGIPLTTSTAGSNPTAGPYWASFNGTTSSLALSSVPFQMADDHCVIGCVTFYDTTGNYLWASQGTALIGLRAIAGKAGAVWYDDGAAHLTDLRGTTTIVLGQPYVLCMWTVGGVHYMRLNGVTENSVAKPAYGASTLTTSTIGSSAGSGWLNGGEYDLQPIKGTLTLAQVVTLEKAAAQRAGLTI